MSYEDVCDCVLRKLYGNVNICHLKHLPLKSRSFHKFKIGESLKSPN